MEPRMVGDGPDALLGIRHGAFVIPNLRETREQRWAEREKARRNEHEQEAEEQAAKIELVYQESRLGEVARGLGAAKANLELELKRHFQSRFLSPEGTKPQPDDLVAAQWAKDPSHPPTHGTMGMGPSTTHHQEIPRAHQGLAGPRQEILTRFQDQLLSLLVRASREASRLGCARFEPQVLRGAVVPWDVGQAALLGLFRCPVGKDGSEICRQGLEGSEDDVTERLYQSHGWPAPKPTHRWDAPRRGRQFRAGRFAFQRRPSTSLGVCGG
eukprot:Skav232932  [mRNA]  locus=scaffold1477:1079107:1088920:- [translate_table: standard]